MRAAREALALAGGAALLLWPAFLNGYPLLFSDTGAFLAQTVEGWLAWDKPVVYGPLLHAFHWRVTLWLPALAQGLLLSWLLRLALGAVQPQAGPGAHLLLCAGLGLFTAAPWFAALLMPDMLAPALVLALFLLGWAEGLGRGTRLALVLVAALAAAAHLAHLPIAAALLLLALAARRPRRAVLRCLLPLLLAVGLLLAGNLALQGRFALSPHGAVFALARLVADGPAARTIAARCPAAGWHLCAWAGRLPTDADEFLWRGDGPVWGPPAGGPVALAPEAGAILRETLWREPLGVAAAALANGVRQLGRVQLGDTLVSDYLAIQVGRQLAFGFPAAEQRRFAASLQAAGALPALAAPLRPLHALALLLGAAAVLLALLRLAQRPAAAHRPAEAALLGLLLCGLVAVTVNALTTGALSGPAQRYQARIAWLLPLAAALTWLPAGADAKSPRSEGRGHS